MFRILVLSDFHSGHLLGLTPPEYHADAYPWQAKFWQFYADYLQQVGQVDALVLNGDLVDGPGRKDSSQHIRTDINVQVAMAAEIAEQVQARRRYVVRGTGYHTDGYGAFEDHVASDLDCDAFDELRLAIHGRKLHLRHHVGRSDIPYGQYTQVGKELINEMLQSDMEDYEDADILGRAHVHYCTGVWMMDATRGVPRHGFTNPALQLRGPQQGSYVRKLRTWMYHVGGTLIEIDGTGEPFIRPHAFPLKLYAPEMREYIWLTGDGQ